MPTEVVLASAADSRKKLSEPEQALLKRLNKADSVEVVVPGDIDPDGFKVALGAVCKQLVIAHLQEEVLMPVLGRLLVVAQENPELYEKKFDTFEAFIVWVTEEYGISRSTAYEAKALASRWGAVVTTEQFKRIGRVKMRVISKAIGRGDEGKAKAKGLLEAASTMTANELRDHAEKKGYIEAGTSDGGRIVIPCTQKVFRQWNKFIKDEAIQGYVESSDPGVILEHMIMECQSWAAQHNQKETEAKAS